MMPIRLSISMLIIISCLGCDKSKNKTAYSLLDITNDHEFKSAILISDSVSIIPKEVLNSKDIVEIDFSHNFIEQIPGWFCDLDSLKFLNLTYNKLTDSNNIFCLGNLSELNLSNNKIENLTDISSSTISILNLNYNLLEDLPEDMSLLGLTHIYLDGNKFDVFPEVLLELKNLKRLSIAENHISKLPSNIGILEQLEVLSITDNPIDSVELFRIKRNLPNCIIYF